MTPDRKQRFAELLLGGPFEPIDAPYPPASRPIRKSPPVRTDERIGTTVYKSECFICNQGCDAEVHVRDGAVVRVEGYEGSHITRGTLCSKGLASRYLLDPAKRLLYPMRRRGERGSDQWERITWDDALGEVAGRLREIEGIHGRNSIVLATGTNRGWVRYFGRFANAFRKQWMGPGIAQCFYPRMTAQLLLFGATPIENPHYEETKCLLVWGCNPTSTWPVKAMGMMDARARGARMIVVDPVLSETASKADLWLQLRPGTDAALALGMLHVIVEESLLDGAFVREWCYGFDRLRERLRQFEPSRVEEITWVPADLIRQAARLYATTKPASITECLSTDQNADTISTCRAMAILAAVTGNIDVPGGNIMSMPKKLPSREEENLWSCLEPEDHEERLGSRAYPLLAGKDAPMPGSAHNHSVWQAVLTGKPYPVKAIYCHGSNMLLSYANTRMVHEALSRLDFFVVADLFMTETARIADILLPGASWLERNAVTLSDQTSIDTFHLQQKAAQVGEARTDVSILNDLAARLGFGDRMFATDEAYADFLLGPSGLTWEEFRATGDVSVPWTFRKFEHNGFNTPSRKIQLYDERLEQLGFDPLPVYREPTESPVSQPALASLYPFVLTTGGRVPVFRHSELRNIKVLQRLAPEPLVLMHPDTAADVNVGDGETVVVETPRGDMEARAQLTPGIDRRVIQAPSHWPGKGNVNLVTDNANCAPMIGSIQLRCQLCRVRKKEE